MKKLSLIAIIWLAAGGIRGQSLAPMVIASTGNFADVSGYSLSSTCGELIIATATNGNILTQGFQQNNVNNVLVEEMDANYSILLYPNPATDQVRLYIQGDNSAIHHLQIQLFDLLGQRISSPYSSQSQSVEKTFTFDLSALPAAIYLVRVTDTRNNVSKTIQFNKVN